ncbi:MAG: DUF502 domain-containing protein [Arenicellales bacterium]|nr:DUF502 domain-containing protein [Arenicellales bacterium]
MGRLRTWLVAGLLVWVPLGVTFLVVKLLIDLADQVLLLLPEAYRPDVLLGFNIPGLGVALTVLTVLATGMVFANLFGRRLVRLWEDMLARIPLVRSIYSSVKQITETLFSTQGKSFRKVVLVEYPRRELWTLAFLTGETAEQLIDITGRDLVSIYVPTTPNPTSGFFIMVPKEDIVELDITVEAGLKLILSTGVVVPDHLKEKALEQKKLAAQKA